MDKKDFRKELEDYIDSTSPNESWNDYISVDEIDDFFWNILERELNN